MKKGKVIHFLAVGLWCLFLVGCDAKTPNAALIEINDTNVSADFNLSKLTESCLFVKLETQPNCLIGDIDDIQYVDNKIFILSSVQGGKEVFVFDQSGRFLNKIGKKGNGPQEYLAISTIGVNSFEKQVILIDQLKKKIHKFDYSGNYLESLPSKEHGAFINKVRFVAKDRIRYVSQINAANPSIITESDENLDHQESLFTTNFTFNGGYQFAKYPITATGNYFLKPLSDSIYVYNKGHLEAAYKFKLKTYYEPVDELKNGGEFDKAYMGAIKKGFLPLNALAECKDYLLIQQFFGNPVLWNKRTNQGSTWDGTSPDPTTDNILLHSNSFITGFDKGFMAVLTYEDLSAISDYYLKGKVLPKKDIENLLRDINMEDNPSIGIYFFK